MAHFCAGALTSRRNGSVSEPFLAANCAKVTCTGGRSGGFIGDLG